MHEAYVVDVAIIDTIFSHRVFDWQCLLKVENFQIFASHIWEFSKGGTLPKYQIFLFLPILEKHFLQKMVAGVTARIKCVGF